MVAGTQTERRTYASILAQTEEVSLGGENTDKMDVDTPPPPTNTPTSPAATPSANTTNVTPTSADLARAFVVHGIAFFFFFFFISILAYGLYHGESPWLRKAT